MNKSVKISKLRSPGLTFECEEKKIAEFVSDLVKKRKSRFKS